MSDGRYIAVKYNPYSIKSLVNLAELFDVPNVIPNEDFHTTLIYSKVLENDYDKLVSDIQTELQEVCFVDRTEIWKTQSGKNALVLKLRKDEYLKDRHKYFMNTYGFSYDYDEYKSHITLSYNADDWDKLEEMNKYIKEHNLHYFMVIQKEYMQNLNLDWNNS